MSEAISLTIESQSTKKEVTSVCHINTRLLGLQNSLAAQQLYRRNFALFTKLNNATTISNIEFHRSTITKTKVRTNKLSSAVLDSYEFTSQKIANLDFDNDIVRPKRRYVWPSGKFSDVDMLDLAQYRAGKKQILDVDRPNLDDLKSATLVCISREIPLFQENGVRTFLFTDNLDQAQSIKEVSYEVSVSIETIFDDYINQVVEKLQKSINFIQNYVNSIERSRVYNGETSEFKIGYTKEVLAGLGMEYPFPRNSKVTSNNRIRNSEIGTAGRNYYNALLLLKQKVSPKTYDNIILTLLPLKSTSPKRMFLLLQSFRNLKSNLEKIYRPSTKNINARKKSAVSLSEYKSNKIRVRAKEKFEVENDQLGYHVFTARDGMQMIPKGSMRQRIASEKRRYYSGISNNSPLPNLSSDQKKQFLDMSSAPAFLTPIAISDGLNVINLERGIFSVDPDEVIQFRLRKSIKRSRSKTDMLKTSVMQNKLSSTASKSFNFSIGAPMKSALELKRKDLEEPNIDAREFVGDDSFFVTDNPEFRSKNFKRLFRKFNKTNSRVLKKIVPNMFLRKKNTIKSSKQISLKNRTSKLSKAVINNKISIRDIPPQIRAMALLPIPTQDQSDPIKNSKLGPIIKETQMNIYLIKYLDGFAMRPDGFVNVHSPTYKLLSNAVLQSNKPLLVKAEDYEVQELGILKDKSITTIYNSLIYIKSK